MITFFTEDQRVSVPDWVMDLTSFCRWADSAEAPEQGRIGWLSGEVWIDLSKEQIFNHVLVKTEFAHGLRGLVKTEKLGLFLIDGAMLSSFAADFAGVPDGLFLSTATLQSDRVRLIEGKKNGDVEVQGTADMVLEIVSSSSVQKDTVLLSKASWLSAIAEYWLVDALQEPPVFDILRYTSRGYVATRKQDGWLKSQVFVKSFRFTQSSNALGHPEYNLEVR